MSDVFMRVTDASYEREGEVLYEQRGGFPHVSVECPSGRWEISFFARDRQLVVRLVEPADPIEHLTGMLVQPMSGNTIGLRPAPRRGVEP